MTLFASQETKVTRKAKEDMAKWAQELDDEEEEKEERNMASRYSQPKSTTDSRTSRLSQDSDVTTGRQRRSGVPEYRSTDGRDMLHKSRTDSSRESASKENNRNSANNSSTSSSTAPVASKSKISNILKSFEHKDEEVGKPRSSVNSSVDVSSRKKSFENLGARSGDVSSYHARSTDHQEAPLRSSVQSAVTSQTSSALYTSSRNSGKVSYTKVNNFESLRVVKIHLVV